MPESSNGDPILSVTDLTVDSGGKRVLDGVSLDVARGDRFGIAADSDAARSTLASAFLNALPDTDTSSGEIRCVPADGESISILELGGKATRRFRWETISLVEENASNSFNPTTTIRTQFEETLQAHRADVRDGLAYSREILSALDLDSDRVLDAYPEEMAVETKERAAIALSLLLEPEIVVFDELPSTLEPHGSSSLESLQDQFEFTAIPLSTDFPTVAAVANRIAVLYEGEIVEVGSTQGLLDDPTHPYTRTLVDFVE